MTSPPNTFLFTDLENSTDLWEQFPDAMHPVLARHDDILKIAVESNNGRIVKTTGDGLHAVFGSPADCAQGALTAQQTVSTSQSPAGNRRLRPGEPESDRLLDEGRLMTSMRLCSWRWMAPSTRRETLIKKPPGGKVPMLALLSIIFLGMAACACVCRRWGGRDC